MLAAEGALVVVNGRTQAAVGIAAHEAGHAIHLGRAFDDAGRLWKVTDWLANQTVFGYDADSNLTSQAYPNGTTAAYTADAAQRRPFPGPVLQCCMCRREARDRHAEWRARHVIKSDFVEELDRLRFATMFAANPDFECRATLASLPSRHLHELTDAFTIEELLEVPPVLAQQALRNAACSVPGGHGVPSSPRRSLGRPSGARKTLP